MVAYITNTNNTAGAYETRCQDAVTSFSHNVGLETTVAVHKMMLLGTPTKSSPKGAAAIRS
jgi:hypothetical protein